MSRERSFDTLALGFITLLCVALRVYHLGAASLWSDETFARYYPQLFGFHYLLTDGLSKETTPPTYYILLRGWMGLWGQSEAALRSLSTLASTLCIPVTYWLGRELFDKRQGLAGALLLALCPASVYFAQEARAYALFMLAVSVLLWSAAVFQRDARSVKAAVFYLLSATLCLYLHTTGLLLVVACASAVWLSLLVKGASARPALWKWTVWNGIVLLLGLPYFLKAFQASHSALIDYIPPAGLHQLVYSTSLLVSGILTTYPWPSFLLAAAVFLTLAISLRLHPLSSRANLTLIGVPCLFVAFVLLISVRRPILLPRVLVWAVVPFCVTAGRQLLVAGRVRVALLLSLVAAFGTGLFFQLTAPNSDKEPWRNVAQAVAPELERADIVVLSPFSSPMVLPYCMPQLKNVRYWDIAVHPTITSAAAEKLHIPPITEFEILQAIKEKRSVWIVTHSFDLNRVGNMRGQVPSTYFRVWSCGKVPCVAVVGWQPRP